MTDRFFDPRSLPDGGRSLGLALDLCSALALLDGDDPPAWPRVRGAALRYLTAVRAGRFSSGVALDLLRRAVGTWTPRSVPPERRARLDARLAFWVGTVYGLRWRVDAAPAPVSDDDDEALDQRGGDDVVWQPAPPPGRWAEMRVWRAALGSRQRDLRARRAALVAATAEREERLAQLRDASADRIFESRRLRANVRGRLATWPTTPLARVALLAGAAGASGALSDADIRAIARRIRRAVHERQADDPRDDILARHRELSPEDEARVEAALRTLGDEDA